MTHYGFEVEFFDGSTIFFYGPKGAAPMLVSTHQSHFERLQYGQLAGVYKSVGKMVTVPTLPANAMPLAISSINAVETLRGAGKLSGALPPPNNGNKARAAEHVVAAVNAEPPATAPIKRTRKPKNDQ
jgi:hypothetical protein